MNNAKDIALEIDPDHTSGVNSRSGKIEYRCSCPNVSNHKKTGSKHDKGKSFSISESSGPFGVVWTCYKCDKTQLSDFLIEMGIIKIPSQSQDHDKKKRTSDAQRQMLAKRRQKLEDNKAKAEEAKKARAENPVAEDDDGERYLAYTFEFEGQDGEPFVQERRFQYTKNKERKDPIPFRFENGEWIAGLGGLVPPLQFQVELRKKAEAGQRVYLFEGPKKAQIAIKDGLFATSHIGGSKRPWHDSYTECLRGAEVYVVCDYDEPGRKWGLRVCTVLHASGIKCKLIELPDLKNEGDDYEQYREKHSLADFLALCNAERWFLPPPPKPEEVELKFSTFDNTDKANAERLVARFGRYFRWTRDGGFYGFTGRKFEQGEEIVGDFALRSAELITEEAAKAPSEEARNRLVDWAKTSESGDRISTAVRLAKTHRTVRASVLSFDPNPLYLNMLNGVLDMDRGVLMKSSPDYLCSKIAPYNYSPEATSPVFDEYMKVLTDGDTELEKFLLRCAGYTITGLTGEECFFFLYGGGRNGKSKFIDAISLALGEYSGILPPEALMAQQQKNSANYELAGLVGKRLVMASETEQSQRLAEAFVKRITGGSIITCRNLGREFFEYRPSFKVWMDGNHKPTIKGNDVAMRDRLILIKIGVYVPKKKRDKNLVSRFRAERAGILNRMLVGLADYRANGLSPTQSVLDACEEYFADMDTVGDWIAQRAIIAPTKEPSRGSDLLSDFVDYSKQVLERDFHMSDRAFYENLEKRDGVEAKRTNQGKVFFGITLLPREGQAEQTVLPLRGRYASKW